MLDAAHGPIERLECSVDAVISKEKLGDLPLHCPYCQQATQWSSAHSAARVGASAPPAGPSTSDERFGALWRSHVDWMERLAEAREREEEVEAGDRTVRLWALRELSWQNERAAMAARVHVLEQTLLGQEEAQRAHSHELADYQQRFDQLADMRGAAHEQALRRRAADTERADARAGYWEEQAALSMERELVAVEETLSMERALVRVGVGAEEERRAHEAELEAVRAHVVAAEAASAPQRAALARAEARGADLAATVDRLSAELRDRDASVAHLLAANGELRRLHGLATQADELEAVHAQLRLGARLDGAAPPAGGAPPAAPLACERGDELQAQAALGARLAELCEQLQAHAAQSERQHAQAASAAAVTRRASLGPAPDGAAADDAATDAAAATTQAAALHALAGAAASWAASSHAAASHATAHTASAPALAPRAARLEASAGPARTPTAGTRRARRGSAA